jgi:hypothetical protein
MHREPGLATEKEIGETWIAADRPSTRLDHFDICKSVGRLLRPAKLTMAARFAACPKNPEYSHAHKDRDHASPPAQLASSSPDPFTRNHQAQFAWIAHRATVLLLG